MEEIGLLILLSLPIIFGVIVWILSKVDEHKEKKFIKNIKPGDVFVFDYSTSPLPEDINPFDEEDDEEPEEQHFVVVKEVRYNDAKVPYVKYVTLVRKKGFKDEELDYETVEKMSFFLKFYNKCENFERRC